MNKFFKKDKINFTLKFLFRIIQLEHVKTLENTAFKIYSVKKKTQFLILHSSTEIIVFILHRDILTNYLMCHHFSQIMMFNNTVKIITFKPRSYRSVKLKLLKPELPSVI